MNFIYRTHAIERMFERDISDEVVSCLNEDGEEPECLSHISDKIDEIMESIQ